MLPKVALSSRWTELLLVALAAIGVLCLAPVSRAQDRGGNSPVSVLAEVSDLRFFVGEPVRLRITVSGARSFDAPNLDGRVEGFTVRYVGGQDVSRSMTTIVNGRRTDDSFEGYICDYELIANQPGAQMIPAIDVVVGGKTYRTSPVVVEVFAPQSDPDVLLKLEVNNPEPYEGEPIRLRVTIGLARNAKDSRFAVPGLAEAFELVGPAREPRANEDVANILGFDTPLDRGETIVEGTRMATLTGELLVIPKRSGAMTLGPGTIACSLVMRPGRGFFQNDELRRVVVPSNPVLLRVKPLPTEGRPSNFNGLVGRYSVVADAQPRSVNVGDPISLTVRAMGPLAVAAPAPALSRQSDLTQDFRVGEEGKPISESRQVKEWTRTLRALRDDVSRIPPIELPYFDPETGKYEIARSPEIELRVQPTRVVTALDAVGSPSASGDTGSLGPKLEDVASGVRHSYTGLFLLQDQSFDLVVAMSSPLNIAVVAGPPLLYAGAGVLLAVRRRRGARESARSRRRRALSTALAALESPDISAADAVRGYVADCFERTAAALTTQECVQLMQAASPEAAASLGSLLAQCDMARFGAAEGADDSALRAEARRALREVDPRVKGGA